jgi:hypothetical protein
MQVFFAVIGVYLRLSRSNVRLVTVRESFILGSRQNSLERDLSAVPFLFFIILLGVLGGLGGSMIDLPFLAPWRLGG